MLGVIFAYYKPNIYQAKASLQIGTGKKLSSNDMLESAFMGDMSSHSLDT
jgi:hypothetical protein